MPSTTGRGCTAHFDESGVWYCTYDEPAVTAFKQITGRDPYQIPNGDEQWVKFRAGYMTDFLSRAREMQKKEFPALKLGVLVTLNASARNCRRWVPILNCLNSEKSSVL